MKKYWPFITIFISSACYAQEFARILEHNTTYSLSDNQTAEIKEHYRIRINSEKGNDFSLYRDYSDKFRKIVNITIDIFDASGKKVKRLNRNDGVEIGFSPSYEINDAKTLVIPTEYQQYPYVMEVNSLIRLNGFISLPTWNPRDRFHLAVDQSSLVVRCPKGVQINIKTLNITGKKEEESGKVIERFDVRQLAHVDPKVRYRDFYNAQPRVMISPDKFKLDDAEGSLNSWASFGDWFATLNNQKFELTDKTKEFISGLDKSDSQRLTMITKLYEYMQDRTRYVSIQLGIGGFKSLPTEDVEKFGYGDCKALTMYMKNMLAHAGVKSNFILARAGSDVPDVLNDFPSNQFNHVYLGIPSATDTLYLECTSQTNPANYTGTFTDDRNVLWIEPNASKMIRSRIYDHRQNEKKSLASIDLDAEGNSNVQFDVENRGIFFDEIMIYDNAPGDYVSKYNNEKFTYSDFTLQNFSFKQPVRETASFNAKYNLKVKGLGKLAGNQMIFPSIPVAPLRSYIEQDEMKKYCSIKRGVTIKDEIEVKVPSDFWITNLPERQRITSRFGEYTISIAVDGETLKVKRMIVLYKGDYTKADFDEFKTFYEKLEKIEGRKLVFNSKT